MWILAMIMFVITLSAEDFIGAKMHIGIALLAVNIIQGGAKYIVHSRFLNPFSKEKKELVLVLFTGN